MSVFLPGEYLRSCPGINLVDGGGVSWSFDAATNTLTLTGDGSGGGFDADTLDGVDSAAFAQLAQAEEVAGAWDFNAGLDIDADNQELRLGTSNDLRLFHDGTDSHIHNETGNLVLTVNGELAIDEVTTGTAAPAAGAGDALPATPAGYVTLIINGNTRQLAFY